MNGTQSLKNGIKTIGTRRDFILNPSPLATGRLQLHRSGRLHYFSRLGRQQLKINNGRQLESLY
jgi:hypothetical protein